MFRAFALLTVLSGMMLASGVQAGHPTGGTHTGGHKPPVTGASNHLNKPHINPALKPSTARKPTPITTAGGHHTGSNSNKPKLHPTGPSAMANGHHPMHPPSGHHPGNRTNGNLPTAWLRPGVVVVSGSGIVAAPYTGGFAYATRVGDIGAASEGDPGVQNEVRSPVVTKTAVQVTEVASACPAAELGIQAGDIILAFDRVETRTFEELSASVQQASRSAEIIFVRGETGESVRGIIYPRDSRIGISGQTVALAQ